MTPWSIEVEITGPDRVTLHAMLSLDPGPAREFRPFLAIELDEAHATEALCKLGVALEQLRHDREAAVRPAPAPTIQPELDRLRGFRRLLGRGGLRS